MHIMDGKKGTKMRITRRRGDRGEDGKEDKKKERRQGREKQI